MLKKLVHRTNSILKEKTIDFDFANPPIDPIDIAAILRYNMIEYKGLGLSAPQIGYNYSIFAIGNPQNEDSILVFFNPNIVHYSNESILLDEGCLSFPELFLKIKRPSNIRMRYTGATGLTETSLFTGMTARVIQHEYDHLQGTVFTQRTSKTHLERAKRNQKRIRRGKKNVA